MNCYPKWLSTVCRVIAAVLFIVYFLYLVYLTFFSHLYGRDFMHRSINLIPFRTIMEYATASYNHNIIVINLFGNILAFAPLGFLLPFLFKKLSTLKTILLIAVGVSIVIEIAQFAFGVGAADVDDVILNAAGGVLGYMLFRITLFIIKRHIPHLFDAR